MVWNGGGKVDALHVHTAGTLSALTGGRALTLEVTVMISPSIGRRFTSSRPILGSTERWHSAIQSTASGSNILSPVRPVVPSRRYTDPAASTKQLVRSASSTEHAISKADGSLFS